MHMHVHTPSRPYPSLSTGGAVTDIHWKIQKKKTFKREKVCNKGVQYVIFFDLRSSLPVKPPVAKAETAK